MTVPATCECGNVFDVDEALIGGITNCPRCGKAVSVPGLRDPLWRAVQIGAVALGAGAVGVVWALSGPLAALGAAVVVAGLYWLLSEAL